MLLRLKTSQASYVCRGCVLKEGNESSLKEAEEQIETIMQKEKEATESAAEGSILLDGSQIIADGKSPNKEDGKESVNASDIDQKKRHFWEPSILHQETNMQILPSP